MLSHINKRKSDIIHKNTRSPSRKRQKSFRATGLYGNKENNSAAGKLKSPSFTLSEFARMVILIPDDPECRPAFLNASRTLVKCSKLDLKKKPADNWVTIIEKRFNYESLQL